MALGGKATYVFDQRGTVQGVLTVQSAYCKEISKHLLNPNARKQGNQTWRDKRAKIKVFSYHNGQWRCSQIQDPRESQVPEPSKTNSFCLAKKNTSLKRITLRYQQRAHTFPIGFILRNSGVLLVTPIAKSEGTSIFTPTYSAAMSALSAFLFPLYVCNTCNHIRFQSQRN